MSPKRIRGSGFQPPKCNRTRRCYDSYKHRLFTNEIMLLPYYIAALNIEHAFFEQAGTYEAFEGLCFVDTLDLANQPQGQLGFMTAANTQRAERQLCRNVSPAETRASQANRVLANPLTVGQPLPSLPIWLTPELGLPLDLEAS